MYLFPHSLPISSEPGCQAGALAQVLTDSLIPIFSEKFPKIHKDSRRFFKISWVRFPKIIRDFQS